jgi:hypothetical protein
VSDAPEGAGGSREPLAPRDRYYRGVIRRSTTAAGRTLVSSASEYLFKYPFVQIVGPVPRVDGLREGMEVGFDVGWTSRGLRVTVIRAYD